MYTESQLKGKTEKALRQILEKEYPNVAAPDEMATHAELVELILDHQPADAAGEPEQTSEEAEVVEDGRKPRKWRITVHAQEGVEKSEFIKVQPNGVMYQIKRNAEAIVPDEVKHVLDNAVMSVPVRQDNGEEVWMDVPRFSYTVHGPA